MRKSEELLRDYIEGTANEQQRAVLEKWYAELDVADASNMTAEQRKQQLAHIRKQLPGYSVRIWPLWKRLAVASSIVLAVGISSILFYNSTHRDRVKLSSESHDVEPGVVGATLTLANGTTIDLNDITDGEVARQAGVCVTKTADGQLVYEMDGSYGDADQINMLATDKGQTYVLILPDKTKVRLNAASSLTYSASLNKGMQRKVSLRGEAYFEVEKDAKRPFVVQTGKQTVHVLGTHFNINGYEEEDAIATTLVEGSVKVLSDGSSAILHPGEQALNSADGLIIKQVDLEAVVDWTQGDFYFNHVDFKTAMNKIARWYDVDIIYDPSFRDDIEAGGWIARKNKLSSVLETIESSGLVHFKIQGRKVYVYP
ncbi:FecR family protein [Sphingobacterium griseoflavum]|uniref:Iron dicitrate transporter FecR n=1 Tax=Sphingobacterium griseoflavum TaxID=1474952 RepID=A0ABQ3I2S0_9SPHI|nr:FecR family protein [Sphingobacterium griseoflavum]GHE48645.1 iron dicitrate transporter FecR [Sphingobacterium griseoflavum]